MLLSPHERSDNVPTHATCTRARRIKHINKAYTPVAVRAAAPAAVMRGKPAATKWRTHAERRQGLDGTSPRREPCPVSLVAAREIERAWSSCQHCSIPAKNRRPCPALSSLEQKEEDGGQKCRASADRSRRCRPRRRNGHAYPA